MKSMLGLGKKEQRMTIKNDAATNNDFISKFVALLATSHTNKGKKFRLCWFATTHPSSFDPLFSIVP